MNFYKEVHDLTVKLVNIPSVNNTTGEAKIADEIADYIKNEIEYFKTNPQNLWKVPLKDDPYGRKNVIALLKGKKACRKTVILHGHIDTVGVEDYGKLADFAYDPVKLEKELEKIELPREARKDLESGEWMFGRGVGDMKSGVAVHLAVLKYFASNIDQLKVNIIFMANPVEENQHTGIIESLDFLEDLKIREDLDYKLAINDDFTAPLFKGDKKKYIHLGAVGKLLPCFYIVGKETHVGQCYEGLDPNLIASEIIRLINLNAELCDDYNGEYTLPPTALKFADTKSSYNVQTPLSTHLYFNYFTHDIPINKVMDILKDKAETAFRNTVDYIDGQYKNYCKKAGFEYEPIRWEPIILSYEELYERVKKAKGDLLDEIISKVAQDLLRNGEDTRVICYKVVEEVIRLSDVKDPMVVVFFSPPFCPHNTIKGNNENEKELLNVIKEVADEMAKETGETFEISNFFPFLSDSSYLTMDDDNESINALINNFPEWYKVYPVPVKKIRETNIPAINMGVYGKDAHKWTERVHKSYSFETLPKMIVKTIQKL